MQTVMKKSDRWIPYYFVAFFVVLAILDGIFVTIAVSTHTGVVTDNAYQKGLGYNKTIEQYEQQQQLGWQGKVEFNRPMLAFSLKDKDGKAINGAEVVAYFTRPSKAGYDFSAPLKYSSQGVYSDEIKFPLEGLWEVRIEAKWNEQQYQKGERIVVK